jgi:organic radical activating enzyme
MKKIETIILKPLEDTPKLVQHFVSLEGEGGTIGRSALYIRSGVCSLRCNFCDTKFSVEGKEEFNIVDMTTSKFTELLNSSYSIEMRQNITNMSFTGGEPLLHINNIQRVIDTVKKSFVNLNSIIFETNGTMLSKEENCLALIKQVGILYPDMKFMLSISPKLSATTSYSNIVSDDEVYKIYIDILQNYRKILDAHFNIQIKFVHSDVLLPSNEKLINHILSNKILTRNQILIMPFTPDEPTTRDKKKWEDSKDAAAKYAMQNYFRYSPRIHIDRRLD